MIIQPIGEKVALTTSPTTLGGARYISCYNTTGGIVKITIKDANGVAEASVSMAGGERFTLVKFDRNTIEGSGAGIDVVPLVRTQ